MIDRLFGGVKRFILLHWRRILLFIGIILCVALIVIQFVYPTSKLAPYTNIDAVSLGGQTQDAAIKTLDAKYASLKLPIYFGAAKDPYRSPTTKEVGITTSNTKRVHDLAYPWYLRIIPSSLFWAHLVLKPATHPVFTRDSSIALTYINKELGSSCNVAAKDASLTLKGSSLQVVDSSDGGTCKTSELQAGISLIIPDLQSSNVIKITVTVVPPQVSNAQAKAFATSLTQKVGSAVNFTFNTTSLAVPATTILSWLDFSTVNGKIAATPNESRAASYLNAQIAPKVNVPAGTTTVATTDFTETSRSTGATGKTLDVAATLSSLSNYLSGGAASSQIVVTATAPKVVYSRTYTSTDAGLNAVIANFAASHPGSYGVSMYELSGQQRRASYNDTTQFTTASTYKLFVAYSTLLRIENGQWHWTDQIQGGNDLTTCFQKMIQLSDNACAEAILNKIGYTAVTQEANAIGATHTSFLGSDGIKSTPADEALFLGELQSGQILSSQADRDTLINNMKQNVYRKGIPSGTSAVVADKVGFLDDLLHDAAIVYSPSGTYVLVIMTNESSWANIAELTKEIEAVRNQ